MNIGIIGANGFLGRSLASNFKEFDVIGITKDNYNSLINHKFDILINANGNSKKYWANEHPTEDFILSTHSVYKSLFEFEYETYIYISSLDVYKNNVYGFNKKLSENIIKKFAKKYIILRCASIVGDNMKKGVLYDILSNNKQFLTPDSKLQFIPCNEIYYIIDTLLRLNIYNRIFNVCGIGNVSVKELGEILKRDITYNHKLEKQYFNYSPFKLLTYYNIRTTKEYIKTIGNYNERMEQSI